MNLFDRLSWLALIVGGLMLLNGGGDLPFTPAVSGPRTVVILHETAEVTPELSQAFVALRSGDNASYLKSKNHSLLILDDDAVTTGGQPFPLIASLKGEGVPLPATFVLDGKKVVAKSQLTGGAAQVMELLKGAGG
jgi:hypothetical protein